MCKTRKGGARKKQYTSERNWALREEKWAEREYIN